MKVPAALGKFIILVLWCLTACNSSPNSSVNSDQPQRLMPPEMENLCNRLYGKNKRGMRISWKGDVPIVFSFDVSFPKEFIVAVRSAMDTWNKAAGFELFRAEPNPREDSVPANDGRNTFYFISSGTRGESLYKDIAPLFHEDGGLAVTVVSGQANKIVDADIIFDGIANTFSTLRSPVGSFDVESVALHELGHSLGLGHSDNPSSIMYYGESPLNFSLRTLDLTTVKMLDCEYR